MKIVFLILAIIYMITIIIIKNILNGISKDLMDEVNKSVKYKIEIKNLKVLVRKLSGTQYCGNKDICLRKIENELNRIEMKMEEI